MSSPHSIESPQMVAQTSPKEKDQPPALDLTQKKIELLPPLPADEEPNYFRVHKIKMIKTINILNENEAAKKSESSLVFLSTEQPCHAASQDGCNDLNNLLNRRNAKVEYKCQFCEKVFGQLSNLKVHVRTHTVRIR